MRKLMRSIARANMEAQGITRYNKKRSFRRKDGKGTDFVSSYFAETWRKYLTPDAFKKAKAERIRKAART